MALMTRILLTASVLVVQFITVVSSEGAQCIPGVNYNNPPLNPTCSSHFNSDTAESLETTSGASPELTLRVNQCAYPGDTSAPPADAFRKLEFFKVSETTWVSFGRPLFLAKGIDSTLGYFFETPEYFLIYMQTLSDYQTHAFYSELKQDPSNPAVGLKLLKPTNFTCTGPTPMTNVDGKYVPDANAAVIEGTVRDFNRKVFLLSFRKKDIPPTLRLTVDLLGETGVGYICNTIVNVPYKEGTKLFSKTYFLAHQMDSDHF